MRGRGFFLRRRFTQGNLLPPDAIPDAGSVKEFLKQLVDSRSADRYGDVLSCVYVFVEDENIVSRPFYVVDAVLN